MKQTTHQLNHNDIVILNLIKVCLLAGSFDTLYPVQEMDVAVAMVKDIYAKKPEPRAAGGTTPLVCFIVRKVNLKAKGF